MKKILIGIGIGIASLLILLAISHSVLYSFNSGYRSWVNEFQYRREYVDSETDYKNRKMVEDTARAMIANYTTYKLTYETYKDSKNENELSYANQARIQANSVASNYNNYLTQNSYIFKGNLPSGIPLTLPYLT